MVVTTRHAAIIVLLCTIAACDGAASVTTPEITALTETSAGPNAHLLIIELDEFAPLTVQYQSQDGDVLEIESPASQTHTVPLTRLHAERSYTYEIVGHERTGTFETPALPNDLAAVQFTATGTPTTPLTLVHLFHIDGYRGYAAVDGDGEVVWHQRTFDFPFGITRRANGNFVYLDGEAGLVEVTPLGAVVHTLAQDTLVREMHHDAVATPSNTVLFIAFDTREHAGAELKGEAIWEWTPETGAAVKRWTSWTQMSPESDRGPRFGVEWLHANALGIGARGNTLISLHYLNQIVSIAPDWSAIEMRIGGPNATHTPSPDAVFSGQHTAREVGPNRILLFDNGHDRSGPSRALELALGENDASVAWEWQPPRPNYAAAVSSARRLDNGNTLVAFGMTTGLVGSSGPTEVYEVTEQETVAWHLLVDGPSVMYRAEPLSTIAGETLIQP